MRPAKGGALAGAAVSAAGEATLRLLLWVIGTAIGSAILWCLVVLAAIHLLRLCRRRRRGDSRVEVLDPGRGREQDVEW